MSAAGAAIKQVLGERSDSAAGLSRELLIEAFAHFTEAGQRLEERYRLLQGEAQRLREQLVAKEIEIRNSEKLATLGEYSAALAHEVRNPLGAIKLFTSLLRSEVQGNSKASDLVEDLLRSVGSLENTVSNVLQFARSRNLAKAPLHAHNVVIDVINHTRKQLPVSVQLSISIQGSPWLLANEQGIRQVLTNLLANAIHAVGESGCISVVVEDGPNGEMLISVSDSGAGIPDHIRQHLFEPFVTGRQEGTGLGLALVKRIVEEHNGIIQISSEGMTRFDIVIPRGARSEHRNNVSTTLK